MSDTEATFEGGPLRFSDATAYASQYALWKAYTQSFREKHHLQIPTNSLRHRFHYYDTILLTSSTEVAFP